LGYIQSTFDLDVESLTQREKWLVEKLKDFAVIDEDIEACQNMIDAGPSIPSITIRPPDEDEDVIDRMTGMSLKQLEAEGRQRELLHTDWQKETASTIERHVDATSWRYVTTRRVHRVLSNTYSDDRDEDYRIRDAADAMKQPDDPYVHLTPTERAMVQYEKATDDARKQIVVLEKRRYIITRALATMEVKYPDWHRLLYERYVQGEKYQWYLSHYSISERTYRTERKNALKKFDRLAYGLR
jgi:hypothetical protein